MRRHIRGIIGLGASAALLLSGATFVAPLAAAAPGGISTVTLAGGFQEALGCSKDWDETCTKTELQPVSGQEGVFESSFTIPEGTFEYKAVFDNDWDQTYPAGQTNRTLTIGGPTEIKFTYMTKTDDRDERLALTPVLKGDYTSEDDALIQQPVRQPGAGENFYFVLVDRFNDGDESNNFGGAETAEQGGYDPSNIGYYFGGDIKGLEEKLDYIQGLGTSAIWLAPMFKNKAVQGEGADASAGYHGYWVTDFTQIDPHFGTNEEMKQFIDAAHAKGMKVYFDIITNHTADVIYYEEGDYSYKEINEFPYYDADKNVIDVTQLAKDRTDPWPALDATVSFPYTPVTKAEEADIKVPAWLNDVTLYHNRGDSTWEGESVTFGDFNGLDDLMTEHPTVVNGFIDVYNAWIDLGIDGFRIDTVKHVNFEFWEDWTKPVAQHAASVRGDDDFFMFGEIYSADQSITSDYARKTDMDSILDFAFQASVVSYATGASARTLNGQFANDAYFVTPDRSPNALPTFLGNHDMGRVGAMVNRVDNSLSRDQLAHEIMYLTRGQPVVYYGDEQGFAGNGDGTDKESRQPLFGDKGGAFGSQTTVDGTTIGADPLFNTDSAMYKTIAKMADLRDSHVALKDGAQIERYVEDGPGVYAFSRVDQTEKIEYLVAVNNATSPQTVEATALTRDANFAALYGTEIGVVSDADGKVTLEVPALSSIVLKADKTVYAPTEATAVTATAPHPGAALSTQPKISAEIDSDVWQQTSFSWRVVGSDTWTPLGASEAGSPAVYQDLGLPEGTLVEYRVVTTDANGNHSASSTYGSVGIAVGLEDDPGAEFEIYMVNIPGTHQKALGCADNWVPACEASKLVQIENGLYKQTFDLTAGDYEYKVALNGGWDVNYGAGGVFDGSNEKYSFTGGNIDFYWDPVTKIFTNTALGKVGVIAGNFQSQLGCEGDNDGNWQPWCFGSLATNLGDGKYQFETDKVAAGDYEAKATFSTGWDDTVGNDEGGNVKFTLSEDGAKLRFDVDANNKTICVYENDKELFCSEGAGQEDEASLELSADTVKAGKAVAAEGAGFGANELVKFILVSAPGVSPETSVDLGEGYADQDGNLSVNLPIDAGTAVGDYVVVARGSDTDRTAEAALKVTEAALLDIVRISGPDRYDTNYRVVRETHEAGQPVFVATGANFADALSVAPAVAKEGGSLVLTPTASMDPGTLKLLKSKTPSKIYIIGGVGAVSAKVQNQLSGIADIQRVKGKDRYDTSLAVFNEFFANETLEDAFVATGVDFPDALSASAAGGALNAPVLLVQGNTAKNLLPEMVTGLKDSEVQNIHVVGGKGAVNETIAASLGNAGFEVDRLSGPTRYGTNMAVNDFLNTEIGLDQVEGIWLATGKNFPDALSAAVPAGSATQRLVLSNGSCIPKPVVSDWIKGNTSNVNRVTLVGGKGALKSSVYFLLECKG